jgi:glycine dehydrogenase subunit 1
MFRFIPNTDDDKKKMLKAIGRSSVDELFFDIPEEIKTKSNMKIPGPLSEIDIKRHFHDLGNRNMIFRTCFRGAGAYRRYIPSIVNHVISRSEFYTSYTPYQAEVSQGILQVIFEYQTMMCELTGMEVSNASLYDGATAGAEAVFMAVDLTGKNRVLLCRTLNPQTRSVIKTYSNFSTARNIRIEEVPYRNGRTDLDVLENKMNEEVACVLVQYPNFFGILEEVIEIEKIVHKHGSFLIVSTDPISLGLLRSPGELGADVVIGEGQPLGIPLSFGGPYLGFITTKEKYMRRLPGRIVGESVDCDGNRGFILTLQAREQHIRRENSASNICSNHQLNAVAATVYLTVMGKRGISEVANQCLQKAHYAFEEILRVDGMKPGFSAPFFNEFVIKSDIDPDKINEFLFKNYILGGHDLSGDFTELDKHLLYCVTELNTRREIEMLTEALRALK